MKAMRKLWMQMPIESLN